MGHISPEAFEGGLLAAVEDGDRIIIDIPGRSLTLNVPEDELQERLRHWRAPEKQIEPGYLGTYRRISRSAAQGAVVE